MPPTDWNQCYASNDTPWDKGRPSPVLEQYLRAHPLSGCVLVPGCGAGHDAALVASHGAQVMGVDLSPLAIERAKIAHPELPESTWHLGDLFEVTGEFDAAVEHTCLCALPPAMRLRYAALMRMLLKPGALLVGVWFINPDNDPGHDGPPHPLPLPELDALFAEGFEVVEDYVPTVAFAGREGRERLRVLRRVA